MGAWAACDGGRGAHAGVATTAGRGGGSGSGGGTASTGTQASRPSKTRTCLQRGGHEAHSVLGGAGRGRRATEKEALGGERRAE